MKLRLSAFILAIALMVSLIIWTAFTSARLVEESRTRMSLADSESFRIASQFQQSILALDERLLQFALHRETAGWPTFKTEWEALNRWIDLQHLSAPKEKSVLHEIDAAYDDYYAAAERLEKRVSLGAEVPAQEFGAVQKESARLLNLSFKLAQAHRETLLASVAQSSKTLGRFQGLLLGALFLIVIFGASLAYFVYKQLIAPLQVKLVERQT